MVMVARHHHEMTTSLLPSWITLARQGFRRLWARRNLTLQERANLFASYTPPALITASLGGHIR
uniref:Uncharacterized protein n=1 Tax=Mycolicibacterium mucogenicum DSM 44124 TaxID=1226753 RepID=A0A8H2JHA7_MYCMU